MSKSNIKLSFTACLILVSSASSAAENYLKIMKNAELNQYTEGLVKNNNTVIAFRNLTHFYNENKADDVHNVEILKQMHQYSLKNDTISMWSSFLNRELKTSPYDSGLNYYKGLVLIKENNLEQAEAVAKLIYQTSAKKDYAFDLLFDIYSLKNDSDKAIQVMTQLIDFTPADTTLYFQRSMMYLKAGQAKRAQNDLNVFNSKEKATEKSFVLQSEIYALDKQDFKIKDNMKNCLLSFPESTFCFSNFLKSQADKKNVLAIEHYEKHSQAFQNHPEILEMIGKQYELSNQPTRAEAAYKALIALDVKKFDYLRPLLSFYETTGRHNLSFGRANGFLTENPKHDEASAYIKSFLSSENFKISFNDSKAPATAQSIKGDTPVSAESNTAKQMYYSGNFKYLLENKAKIDPKSSNYFFRLGNIYYGNKQSTLAVQTWLKTKSDSATHEASQLNAALVMGQQDFKTKSLQILNTFKFTNLTAEQLKNIKELILVQKSRIPANFDYEAKVAQPLAKYINLDWE